MYYIKTFREEQITQSISSSTSIKWRDWSTNGFSEDSEMQRDSNAGLWLREFPLIFCFVWISLLSLIVEFPILLLKGPDRRESLLNYGRLSDRVCLIASDVCHVDTVKGSCKREREREKGSLLSHEEAWKNGRIITPIRKLNLVLISFIVVSSYTRRHDHSVCRTKEARIDARYCRTTVQYNHWFSSLISRCSPGDPKKKRGNCVFSSIWRLLRTAFGPE